MFPACQVCGKPMEYPSVKKPHTRKKLTREMIKAQRKKGRSKGSRLFKELSTTPPHLKRYQTQYCGASE